MMGQQEGIRINKYLSEAGVCSRREADRLVEAGLVEVDGQVAEPGARILPGQAVTCRGKLVEPEQEKVLLAFNKPKGVICTTSDPKAPNNIMEYIHYEKRVFPVGRLDKDSQGLILLTNDGALMDEILRSKNGHEKEYVVTVNRPVTEEFLQKMREGVYLPELNVTTRKCEVEAVGKRTFRMILTQGLNRQIRRMCQELGFRVEELTRVRIMNIRLGGLREGTLRRVTGAEQNELFVQLGSKE